VAVLPFSEPQPLIIHVRATPNRMGAIHRITTLLPDVSTKKYGKSEHRPGG